MLTSSPLVESWGHFPRERRRLLSLLEETRIEYNIREQDECGYDQGNAPSGVTCAEHFFE